MRSLTQIAVRPQRVNVTALSNAASRVCGWYGHRLRKAKAVRNQKQNNREFKSTTNATSRTTARLGKWISLPTFSFVSIKNNCLPVSLPLCKIVGVLPLLFIFEFSKGNLTSHFDVLYKTWNKLISRCCLRRTAEKPTKLYFARAVCGGGLHDVAVVVFCKGRFSNDDGVGNENVTKQ